MLPSNTNTNKYRPEINKVGCRQGVGRKLKVKMLSRSFLSFFYLKHIYLMKSRDLMLDF